MTPAESASGSHARMAEGPFILNVPVPAAGRRVDQYLAEQFSDCSRAFVAHLVRAGHVTVNQRRVKPSARLRPGDIVRGTFPPPVSIGLSPEAIRLDILYEDNDIIVVDKPAGLVVHPAPGHRGGTLVNALLHHCPDLQPIGGEIRPGIVHRLDKDTSGAIVAVKNAAALDKLAAQFKHREVRKVYLAIVRGVPAADAGRLDWPIGRHPVARRKMSIRSRQGRAAVTLWRVRRKMGGASLLEVDLQTGRTHQIRVHCAAMGHPLLGDAVYGRPWREGPTAGRQMLHAWRLSLTHPGNGERMTFEAPLPDDMQALLSRLEACSNA